MLRKFKVLSSTYSIWSMIQGRRIFMSTVSYDEINHHHPKAITERNCKIGNTDHVWNTESEIKDGYPTDSGSDPPLRYRDICFSIIVFEFLLWHEKGGIRWPKKVTICFDSIMRLPLLVLVARSLIGAFVLYPPSRITWQFFTNSFQHDGTTLPSGIDDQTHSSLLRDRVSLI
ncbi:hypothetical protein E1B28_010959 [Marasmius oreades]|uniref:Uncharacterized protein n=1 Tax=Marasmius oreades TaxID=181124 RepID=A0A9P7RT19_9AGAR|nr:uncharacterized protein E1B28_010959 [Marasmius oreades]KAG7089261.1 hypothetical protein E1B28_010959 [Marasmius oreades]